MTGLIMEGHLDSVCLPLFSVLVDLTGWLFRSDENGDFAVRVLDRSLWEIVAVTPRGELNCPRCKRPDPLVKTPNGLFSVCQKCLDELIAQAKRTPRRSDTR